MLPTELLIHRERGEEIIPKRLPLNQPALDQARNLIHLFEQAQGAPQSELARQLLVLEGDKTDYRVQRGLAHILKSDFSTFETQSPLEPRQLRQRVFALAATQPPDFAETERTLAMLAELLSQELSREIHPAEIQQGLYADLPDNQLLTNFDAPTPEALLQRYNLAQAQGVLYRASHLRLNAHRNDPGEYKLLFRYTKLFGLMTYIEGDADQGFTLTFDGPASLFHPSTRYGLAFAKLLPALLHVTKWDLVASLPERESYSGQPTPRRFTLDSRCGLVSHYPAGKAFDSQVEASFANSWQTLDTQWRLEREVELLPLPGSVMIPDFRLVHPDGRVYLLEIVGYWRPEYLRKKFAQVQRSNCANLILAISERLNLEKAGVKLTEGPTKVVWYKDKLLPKAVLALLDQ